MSLIAFDNSSKGQIGYATTLNLTHTVGNSNPHPYLIVHTTMNCSAVTWNGVALILLHTYQPTWPSGTNCTGHKIWGIANPETGTHTIAVTTTDACAAEAVSYSTVDEMQFVNYSDEDSANHQVATWPPSVSATNNQQWVLCFVSYPSGSAIKIAGDTGVTLRVNQWGSISTTGLAILDLNAEQNSGTHSVPLLVHNSGDNTASDFITTTTVAMEPYRTNVTITPSTQAPAFTFNAPTLDAIQNVTITPQVQALNLTVYTTIPPMIVEPSVQGMSFTMLPIQGVRTARYYAKYGEGGDTYGAKYTHRM